MTLTSISPHSLKFQQYFLQTNITLCEMLLNRGRCTLISPGYSLNIILHSDFICPSHMQMVDIYSLSRAVTNLTQLEVCL